MTSSRNKTSHTARDVRRELAKHASSARAKTSARFFKTGVGEYGHGDIFIGVVVPKQRLVASLFRDIPRTEILALLHSDIHEHRLTGLHILVEQYNDGDSFTQKKIARFYLTNLRFVNNWDLVDSSAHQILGHNYRVRGGEKKLYALARSPELWKRRVAIVSTFAFIREGMHTHTCAIAEVLLKDDHDLIHKSVGWMLREVGKRDKQILEKFLTAHAHHMPRTMLRYAIERFPSSERKKWLDKKVRNWSA